MPILTIHDAISHINKLDHVLTEIYQKHVEEHDNVDPKKLFAEYGEYVIDAIRHEKLEIAEKIMHLMEPLLNEGNEAVKTAIQEGFFVHMDDKLRHIITSFEHFKRSLGPQSRKTFLGYEELMQRHLRLWDKAAHVDNKPATENYESN